MYTHTHKFLNRKYQHLQNKKGMINTLSLKRIRKQILSRYQKKKKKIHVYL